MSETAVPTWVTDMDDPEVLQRALNIAADPTAPSSPLPMTRFRRLT